MLAYIEPLYTTSYNRISETLAHRTHNVMFRKLIILRCIYYTVLYACTYRYFSWKLMFYVEKKVHNIIKSVELFCIDTFTEVQPSQRFMALL